MYETILVPTDGSEATTETLRHALDLAERHDATVHAVYVVDERQYHAFEDDRKETAQATLERKGKRALDEVEMRADEVGVPVETMLRDGVPSETIGQHAENSDVDAIVMGTHGRDGHDRHVKLGSVTERVVKNATVPVMVVHIDLETTMA